MYTPHDAPSKRHARTTHLQKEFHFGLDELRAHHTGVAAYALAGLLEVHFEELGAEGLHLLAYLGPIKIGYGHCVLFAK